MNMIEAARQAQQGSEECGFPFIQCDIHGQTDLGER